MEDLQDLYQEIILDHNKRPRNFGPLEGATHHAEGNNPLCGDEIEVSLRVEDDRVAEIRFQGQGCAISKASASLMTIDLKGRTLEEAHAEVQRVISMLTDASADPLNLDEIGDLASLQGVRRFPARIKCATLSWHAFEAAVEGRDGVSTE